MIEIRTIEIHPSVYDLGAPVFALQPGSKRPLKGSRGLTDAVPVRVFNKEPEQNYAIRLDGLVCVDFDCIDFADEDIAALYTKCKREARWSQRTGGQHQGEHYLFAATRLLPTKSKIQSKSGRGYGEILSGSGVYIVGPNSFVESKYEYTGA